MWLDNRYLYTVFYIYCFCFVFSVAPDVPTIEINNDNMVTNTVANINVTNINNNNNDKLRFHEKCGHLVKLSNNYRTAERRRPLDEFNNGVVMTHRPLKDNELFEV